MKQLSLNEIEVTAARSAVACEWPAGLAEEVGRAAVWAALYRPTAAGALLAMIAEGFKTTQYSLVGPELLFDRATLAAAVSAFDMLKAGRCEIVRFGLVELPDALIALGGAAASAYLTGFRFRAGAGLAKLGPAQCRIETGIAGPVRNLAIELMGSDTGTEHLYPADGAALDEEVWSQMRRLAACTLVPATRQSRETGAGADLVDTD